MVKEFDGVLITSYPHNYTDMKYEIMRHNINLKITLSEIRKMMLRKTKRKKNAVKSRLGSRKVSDFVELALKRSKFTDINDNKKWKKNERMVLQKKKKIQLSQLVNSQFEIKNNSKTHLTAQRRSFIRNVLS